MKVLQLIDSLETGGSERMAVAYANELVDLIDTSFLCVTRKEGLLKSTVDPGVRYLFLNKKRTLDFKAISNVQCYLKDFEFWI